MLELIQQIDVTPESDYKLEVIPIRYGKVTDLYETMNALVSGGGGGGAYPGAARTSATTPQRRAGQLPGAGGALGTSGRYGGFGSRGGTTYGQPQANQPLTATGAQPGATAGTSFQDRLRQIVNRAAGASEGQLLADARIVPDERSNYLIVYATKEDTQTLTYIVSTGTRLRLQRPIRRRCQQLRIYRHWKSISHDGTSASRGHPGRDTVDHPGRPRGHEH